MNTFSEHNIYKNIYILRINLKNKRGSDTMEGVEIVIRPRHLERLGFSLVIIALAVLLILKWNAGTCVIADNETTTTPTAQTGLNETNQTLNATQEEDLLCTNNVKDQDETDVDCGGDNCDPCPEFKNCNIDSDCESGYCHEHIKCLTPTCDDNVKNQGETNIDCGGPCKNTKGEYFYDGECHTEPKPEYSGRVELTIIDVDTSVNEVSGFARIDSLKFMVENGKETNVLLTANIYARDRHGQPYYESSITGDEIAVSSVEIPLLSPGESHTETVEIKRTLTETEPDEEYQLVIELLDEDDEVVRRATWENTQ
ncbi:hypothetical protein AYK26_04770 [Euryarchaeota archaeon SM23-78]|nr:MAG: hypothetical protein AYK26_04770 [Euryarchaeota archaeon SM23-78]